MIYSNWKSQIGKLTNMKTTIASITIFAIITLFSCQENYVYKEPVSRQDGWVIANAQEEGMDLKVLQDFGQAISRMQYRHLHGVLIVKNGKLVFEEYSKGYSIESKHDIASVTKSITSALVGIAIDKGHVKSVEDSVWTYYIDSPYENLWDPAKKAIRIKDLLTMRHGLDCDDFKNTTGDFNEMIRLDDHLPYVLDIKMVSAVDKVNAYCTGSTQLLEPVISSSTSMSVEDFANKNLLVPIGIKSYEWNKMKNGKPTLGFGARMTPRDMAKFGLLYLQKGKWGELQIISDNWISESLTSNGKLFGAIDYGYLWYIEPTLKIHDRRISYYDAAGHGGQTIAIYPSLNMVVVITAGNYNDEDDYYSMLEKYIVKASIVK